LSYVFDALDKDDIREDAALFVEAVLGILVAIAEEPPLFERIAEYVYLVPGPGRTIYPLSAKLHAPRLTLGRVLESGQITAIQRLLADPDLLQKRSSIYRLLRGAVDSQTEPLRAFVAAWTALEIFCTQHFDAYKAQAVAGGIQVQSSVPKRTPSEESRYTLVDKFRVIAQVLNGAHSTADTNLFKRLKQTRDDLIHRGHKADFELLTHEIIGFLRKYLRLHLPRAKA
jgi:hypothetical protein